MTASPSFGRRAALLSALSLAFGTPSARAQPYPSRPIMLIVPAGPGSAPDIRARQIGPALAAAFGQPVIVDNRAGAQGTLAAREAARAAPDGHTLYLGGIALVLNELLGTASDGSPTVRDFTPVTLVAAAPLLWVAGAKPEFRSATEAIALARRDPGRFSVATYGPGSLPQLAALALEKAAGISLLDVPYKSQAQEIPDLVSGQVASSFTFYPVVAPLVQAGRLRVLAVASARRLEVLPDVPTFAELGLAGVEVKGWQGIFVPAGTPEAVVRRLHRDLAAILQSPELIAQWRASGADPGGSSPEQFSAYIDDEVRRWSVLIREQGPRVR